MKKILLLSSFLFFLFGLDWALFRKGQFLLPNESPWNTNHFFNFLYEYKRVAAEKKTKPRILILGSSIAYYSFDASLLSQELKKNTGKDFEVVYLAYAGNSPLYVYLLLDWLFPLEPDLVVYPVNFIDFRLHRTYVMFPGGSNETVSEEALVQDALSFEEAPQSLWVFPWETLGEAGSSMKWETKATYLASGIFGFHRYKDIWLTNPTNLYQHRFGRNTSYHAYAGTPIPEGINSLGWTGKRFSFLPLAKMQKGKEGFWIEVTPFLLAEGLKSNPPGEVSLSFSNASGKTQKISLQKPGWKKVELDESFFHPLLPITAELSHVWYANQAEGAYLDYHYDPMGVRLQQTFGLEHPKENGQYIREPRTEDFRYLQMTDAEYERYFYFRLLEGLEVRPGIGYLVALEKAKKRIAKEKFRPLFHLNYLKKIADRFRDSKIPLLIINNPENPISLGWYESSPWYKDYLAYLKSLESGNVHVSDHRRDLPMQGFSDFHHFTYLGMEQMNPIYAIGIGNLFSK
ncbi:hypothetical protein [Leptospira idonii]|uniref:Uncharacterized protein n=1 Tax=Leptospira idonii TaxID=1193500 RepID=A0A4R9M110_9LEPT|nr:hypothetical protein [Leptospira idonii]TGN19732.1 hypothetical protein EHS15_08130 [Leptospira idonii]